MGLMFARNNFPFVRREKHNFLFIGFQKIKYGLLKNFYISCNEKRV